MDQKNKEEDNLKSCLQQTNVNKSDLQMSNQIAALALI